MTISNFMLFKEFYKVKKRILNTQNYHEHKNSARKDIISAGVSVTISSIGFIVLFIPRTVIILSSIFNPQRSELFVVYFKVFDFICQYLLSFNFFGLIIKNKQFGDEFKLLLLQMKLKTSKSTTRYNFFVKFEFFIVAIESFK